MTRCAKISSTARYIPKTEMTNKQLIAQLAPEFSGTIAKLESKTSIKTRFYADDGWCSSDLAKQASLEAMARAGKKPGDIDLIILGTDSPDYMTPCTSVVLQHKLGATKAGTFDVGCACASFPTGLSIGSAMISSNPSINTILVVGVYLMHKLADPSDPMVFFYGDGAGAAVLEAADSPGLLASSFGADGSYSNCWGVFAGGTKEPTTVEAIKEGRHYVKMVDNLPSSVNDEGWPVLVRQLAQNGGFDISDIDFTIFTQVKKSTIEGVMGQLDIPMHKTHLTMEKWGYTGSACVPIALDDAIEQNKISEGDLVVLVGSGVGYNQAAVALRM